MSLVSLHPQTAGVQTVRLARSRVTRRQLRALRTQLRAALGNSEHIVIDLSDVDYIDSAALGAMLTAAEQARASGGDLKLACPRPAVAAMLELTRMFRVFDIHPSLRCALSATSRTTRASAASR